ncbi:MAG: type III-B CRISPR module RAMP protein Cmr1 [Chloroflexota bacterium]
MPKLTLTVTNLTPLLTHGADGDTPELRAPSVRGVLRYWLRTALGAKIGNRENVLHDEESRYLGSTGQSSAVSVRVISRGMDANTSGELRVLPERMRQTGFDPEGEFRIVLTTHPLADWQVLVNSPLLAGLYLMLNLGGLGKRSRRGSGNLHVLNAKLSQVADPGNVVDGLAFTPADGAALAAYLRDMLAEVHRLVPVEFHDFPTYPTLVPGHARVLVGERPTYTADEALDVLWRTSGPYHHDGGVFGDIRPRRSSAIHMRVNRSEDGYHPVVTVMRSGERSGNWARMKDFMDRCEDNGFTRVYGEDWQ